MKQVTIVTLDHKELCDLVLEHVRSNAGPKTGNAHVRIEDSESGNPVMNCQARVEFSVDFRGKKNGTS